MESTPSEDAIKTGEMTIKDLEYYVNLVDKAVAGFEKTDSNFEKSSTVGKMLTYSIICYKDTVKKEPMWQTSLFSYLKKLQ